MREIRTLRVMRRELETGLGGTLRPTAPVPDPTGMDACSMFDEAEESGTSCSYLRRVLAERY